MDLNLTLLNQSMALAKEIEESLTFQARRADLELPTRVANAANRNRIEDLIATLEQLYPMKGL